MPFKAFQEGRRVVIHLDSRPSYHAGSMCQQGSRTELTVVIPHAGRIAELEETIHSMAGQGSNFSVIVSNMGDPLPQLNSELEVHIVQTPGPWSVGKARNAGAAGVLSPRLFFLDCDITVPSDFMLDALRKIGPGRAWAPIVRNSDGHYNADRDRYRAEGYGNFGIATSDFPRTGGFDEFKTWGKEDNLFHWKCRKLGIRIDRARSDLIHRDHPHVTAWHRQTTSPQTDREIRNAWNTRSADRIEELFLRKRAEEHNHLSTVQRMPR